MTAEIINLRRARKAKSRAEKENDAAANRAKFGRSKLDRELEAAKDKIADRRLEGHRLKTSPKPTVVSSNTEPAKK